MTGKKAGEKGPSKNRSEKLQGKRPVKNRGQTAQATRRRIADESFKRIDEVVPDREIDGYSPKDY